MKSPILKIGVLGGIGPEATAIFYHTLITRLQEKKLIQSNVDFPQIIINSIPAPELIFDTYDAQQIEPYLHGLQELEKMNVEYIVMICNTIHFFFEQLQEKISTPIIDLRKEVNEVLHKQNKKIITLLGTPTTVKNRLYGTTDTIFLNPNTEELQQLTNAIFSFNQGLEKEKQVNIVKNIAAKYHTLGSQIIILACTELAVMLQDKNIPTLNPMDILIDTIIKKIEERKQNGK